MNNDVFNRVLKLALRTGDKVIVVDPNQSKPYVMMDFEEYENLISRPEKFNPEDEIKKSFKTSNMMNVKKSSLMGMAPKETIREPGTEPSLVDLDPLEPESSSPMQVEKIKFSSSEMADSDMETEEHFYLEPVED